MHEFLFFVFLFCLTFQTRILFHPESAYIDWYFNYHLALFVYLTDLIIVLCFINWLIFDKPNLKGKRVLWPIIGLMIWIILTLFHVKQLDLGLYQAVKWLEILSIVAYIYLTFKERAKFWATLGALALGGLFQAMLAISQFHMKQMIGVRWLGEYIAPIGTPGLSTIEFMGQKIIRAYGTFPHPNVLAGSLVLALICWFFYVSYETRQGWGRKLAVSCGTIGILIALFLTFSRVGWLMAAITGVSFSIYLIWQKKWPQVLILGLLGIVSCGTIYIGYGQYLQSRVSETSAQSVSVTDRQFFNEKGMEIIKTEPIMGTGVGNYVPQMVHTEDLPAWKHQPPHNIFIFIAAELGLVGLLLFLWLLYEIVRPVKIKSDLLMFTAYCLLFAVLLLGQFDHYFATIQQGRLLLVVVFGLVAAVPNLRESSS